MLGTAMRLPTSTQTAAGAQTQPTRIPNEEKDAESDVDSSAGSLIPSGPPPRRRVDFPETWLWTDSTVGSGDNYHGNFCMRFESALAS